MCNSFCTCCQRAYIEGLADGYGLGLKRGYVKGFVDASLGLEPPPSVRFDIEAILRPVRLAESEPSPRFLSLTVYDVPRPRRKKYCICPDPDMCVCGA